jgi:peptide-methionine (S)-S-oxide reductase
MGNKATRNEHALYDEASEHYVRRGHFYRYKGAVHDKESEEMIMKTDQNELPVRYSNLSKVVFAAGCFWGTEKSFWRMPGVYATAVGYIGGNDHEGVPTYRRVCSGKTKHAEATLVLYDSKVVHLTDLLRLFFACHDPTQGNRQGNDYGSQYRSGIYVTSKEDEALCRKALNSMEGVLLQSGFNRITTEIQVNRTFWYAESYHQCYLAKPGNRQYCSAEPTGSTLPMKEGTG